MDSTLGPFVEGYVFGDESAAEAAVRRIQAAKRAVTSEEAMDVSLGRHKMVVTIIYPSAHAMLGLGLIFEIAVRESEDPYAEILLGDHAG